MSVVAEKGSDTSAFEVAKRRLAGKQMNVPTSIEHACCNCLRKRNGRFGNEGRQWFGGGGGGGGWGGMGVGCGRGLCVAGAGGGVRW